jgi:hypothetical protein
MSVGGGICSAGASMLVKCAAMEISMACYFYDEFGKSVGGRHPNGIINLSEKSSAAMRNAKSLIAASYELCSREAKSRAELMDMGTDQEQENFRKENFVESPPPEYEEFLEEEMAKVGDDK